MKLSALLRTTADALDKASAAGAPLHAGAIEVWPFSDAPAWALAMVDDHDDADWLVFVPDKYRDEYIGWMESPSFCSYHPNKQYEVAGGKIVVGHHA